MVAPRHVDHRTACGGSYGRGDARGQDQCFKLMLLNRTLDTSFVRPLIDLLERSLDGGVVCWKHIAHSEKTIEISRRVFFSRACLEEFDEIRNRVDVLRILDQPAHIAVEQSFPVRVVVDRIKLR